MNNRYIVEAEFKPNVWTNIIRTDHRDLAVNSANFWDERVNVRFIDIKALTPLENAMRKFDEAIVELKSRRF